MKALVFTAPSVVELQDIAEPVIGPDEVLVHVAAAGICGSELHGVKRPGLRKPPLAMGHEFAGVTGSGTRVVVNPILSCGRCARCVAGDRHLCRDRMIIGVHRPGAFAERVGVPASAVHPIPDSLPFQTASVIEPAANAIHAWALAGRPAGARVGVIGAGAIGLLCALVAAGGGAESVAVADISEARRVVAASVGAIAGTELRGEFDVVFDAVGSVATRRQSMDRLRPGGVAVWLGLEDNDSGFDAAALVRAEKSVMGSFAYTDEEFAEAMRLVAGWRLDWVRSFPLEEGATVFTELMNGRSEPVKALLCPERS